jgi:hypothetical protein
LTFALIASSMLFGAELSYRRVLPGVVHTRGADGTRIETSAWLVNLGSSAGTFEFGFLPAAGVPAPAVQTRIVGAGETLPLNTALQDLFGLSDSDGALIVRGDQPFELRGVNSNLTNPLGAAGLGVRSLASGELLTTGMNAHSLWLANGTDPNKGLRTDITVVMTSPATAVTVSLYDVAGALRGIEVVSSEAPVTWKTTASRLLSDPEISIGRVKFAVTAGEATAFLSVSSGVPEEGLLSQPERVATAAAEGTDLLLNGVTASTSLRIFNPNETEVEVTIEALGISGGPAAIRRTVAPGGLVEISGVLRVEGFGFPESAAGALRIRGPLPVLAAGRGLTMAVPYESGFATPTRPVTLIGLNDNSNQPGVRSRIAVLGGANGARGTLRLRDAFGKAVAASPLRLESSEWQEKMIRDWFGSTEIPADARVDIEMESGSAHGYAEMTDNFAQGRVAIAAAAIPVQTTTVLPPATRLAFGSLPSSIAVGESLSAMVRAVRADNSVDTSFSGSVELRVASGPSALPASTSRMAIEGVASFPGLNFSVPGSYRLTALGAGLEAAVSQPFEVAAPAPAGPTVIRTGTFAGQNGYTAVGTLQIERAANGAETLRLNPNFRVSAGAGTVTVWLARSSGALNTANSVRVGALTRVFSGEFTFPIPAPGSSGFTHVIVYCDAFRINFGAAQLTAP